MSTTKPLPVINREEALPLGIDYAALMEQAIGHVAKYSGEVWTNYNASDPGITLLQNLVYALTELGIKADLPMQDLLARSDGKIAYDDQFVPPQEALTTNPITLEDFRTVLLNEVILIKNVSLEWQDAAPPQVDLPGVAVTVETMPDMMGPAPTSLPNAMSPVFQSVQQVLHKYSNVAQHFHPPTAYPTVIPEFSVTIGLEPEVIPEAYAARLLFALNHFVSPFPEWHTLPEHQSAGYSTEMIFSGPKVSRGYLTSANSPEPKSLVDIQGYELESLILNLDGTNRVQNLIYKPVQETTCKELVSAVTDSTASTEANPPPREEPEPPVEEVSVKKIPLFTWHELYCKVSFTQNDAPVGKLNVSKIGYYLERLMPALSAEGQLFPEKISGNYYDLQDYYSMQYQLPSIYNLTNASEFGMDDPAVRGKVKQLKGYLALMEQTMADFLAQLAHLEELFSFGSGRSMQQVISKTYFFQGVYGIPGIQKLMVGAQDHINSPTHGQTEQQAWQEYQQDPFNAYWRHLTAAQ
ncbi:MAG TPA: hypothetical protein DCR93_29235, partial [Cytophagales bacterium]|nr:hypothetical protein [Cytophagales bacterium]